MSFQVAKGDFSRSKTNLSISSSLSKPLLNGCTNFDRNSSFRIISRTSDAISNESEAGIHNHLSLRYEKVSKSSNHLNSSENTPKPNYLFPDRLQHSSSLAKTSSCHSNLTTLKSIGKSERFMSIHFSTVAVSMLSSPRSQCSVSSPAKLEVSNSFMKEANHPEWKKRFNIVRRVYYQQAAAIIFAGLLIFASGIVLSVTYFSKHNWINIFGPILLAVGLLTMVCGWVWIPIIKSQMNRKKQVLKRTFSLQKANNLDISPSL